MKLLDMTHFGSIIWIDNHEHSVQRGELMYSKATSRALFIFSLMIVFGFVLIQPSLVMADYIVQPSGYWKMEEATNTPPYDDHIGTNDGNCGGLCPTQLAADGVVGNAQSFFFGNSTIWVPGSGNDPGDGIFDWAASDSFSIEFWMRRNAGDILDSNEVIVGRDDGNGTGIHWWVGLRGVNDTLEGQIRFQLSEKDGDGTGILSDAPVHDGEWHHVVAVRDNAAGENRLYVDGVLQQDVATQAYDVGFDSVNEGANFGYLDFSDTPGFWYGGGLDEVAVYDVALSGLEVKQHYLNGKAEYNLDIAFAPVIVSTAIESVALGFTYDYDVDANGNPLPAYSLSGEPDNLTVDSQSGLMDWTPNDRIVGDHSFSVTASNLEGSPATQNLTVGVYDLCGSGEMSGYWKLEEATETPPYDDYIGNNDGTCTDCPTQIDSGAVAGNAQTFFYGNDEIDIPASGNNPGNGIFDWTASDSFSIELWIRRSAGDILDSNEVIIGRDDGNGTGIHWWVGLRGANDANEGQIRLQLNEKGGVGTGIVSDEPAHDGEWHHVVAVQDDVAGEIRLYVDGVLQQDVASQVYTAGFDSVNEPVNIGYLDFSDTAGYWYAGGVDEIAVYDVALPLGVIEQHYSQMPDRGYCNVPPTITSNAGTGATEGTEYTYTPTATDTEGDTLTWSLENEPTGMTVDSNTGAVIWTPGDVTTSGAVTLIADDGYGGTDSEEFTISVTTLNDDPEITSTAPTTATEDVEYTYNPTATDADLDTLTWSLSGQPAGMTIVAATGAISWTPLEGVTTSGNVTLTVDDGNGGTDTEFFTITVTAVNDNPTITSTAATSATEGSEYVYNPTATDPENDTLEWSLSIAPTGMSINSVTGAISWTPAEGITTSGTITLTVSDGNGGTDDEVWTITVSVAGDDDDDGGGGGGSSGLCFIGSLQR